MAYKLGHTARALAARALVAAAGVSPCLLPHVSLLLALVGGAGLATAARLKWDPSTYIAVRQLFPLEYRVASVSLCTASFSLMLLGHVAAVALAVNAPRARRALFLTYAALMTALVCAELAWAAWMAARLVVWLRAQPALVDALQTMRDHMQIVQFFVTMLPDRVQELIQEVKEDVPRNLYVGAAGVLLVGVLQPAAVLLGLLNACARGPTPTPTTTTAPPLHSVRCSSGKSPHKLLFKKGPLASAGRQ